MEKPEDRFEQHLRELADTFPYPLTPDIAGTVAGQLNRWAQVRKPPALRRRLAWVIAAILVLSVVLLSVPTVRAQILEFIQVGIVRIFLVEPSPVPSTTPGPGGAPGGTPTPGSRLSPGNPDGKTSPTPRSSKLNLDGLITLEEATTNFDLPIFLPYSETGPDLPDDVYLQDLGGQVLIMVWLDRTGQPIYSLQILAPGNYSVEKVKPLTLEQTSVNGVPAYWTTGPYLLKLKNKDLEALQLIEGHVLIWAEGEVTYRLETSLTLEEAVRVAESLRPYPQERRTLTPTTP